jgi:hypothetical protein
MILFWILTLYQFKVFLILEGPLQPRASISNFLNARKPAEQAFPEKPI